MHDAPTPGRGLDRCIACNKWLDETPARISEEKVLWSRLEYAIRTKRRRVTAHEGACLAFFLKCRRSMMEGLEALTVQS